MPLLVTDEQKVGGIFDKPVNHAECDTCHCNVITLKPFI